MNQIKKIVFLFLALLCTTASYSQVYNGKQKEINKILDNIKSFSQYYMNGEADKIAACYTKDGKIFPAGQEIIEGTNDLNKFWTLPSDVKVLKHKVTPSEITIVKKTAYDYGYYEGETLLPDGKKSTWKGKYVIVWKKVGNDWKIYLDCWNRIDEPKK